MGTEFLAGAALDAAQAVTGRLARTMGAQRAAHMVHSAALVQHAATVGLICPVGDLLRDVDRLATLHPALAAFCDPAVNHAYGNSAPREVTELWNGHSIADHGTVEQQHAQAGNAVSVNAAHWIAQRVTAVLA